MDSHHSEPRFASPESLRVRARIAQAWLRNCHFCEFRCGADRTRNEPCPCRLGADTFVYKQYVSLHDESGQAPALRVFLGGCNLRCRFCDEGPDCFQPGRGKRIYPRGWARELEEAIDQGVRSISVIGGEPTLHLHSILAVAAAAGRPLPLVLNTNMYMTSEVLDLLDGVVPAYLADFKFGNDSCAQRLAGIPRYLAVVCRNLRQAVRSTAVTIRHLLIPGHFDCCFRPVVDWVAENLPTVPFQLYTGYVPCWRASGDQTIGRLNTSSEAQRAAGYMREAGLAHAVVMDEHQCAAPPPDRTSQAEVSVTLGADGRIYCHDMTPELASLLSKVVRPDVHLPVSIGEGRCPS